MNRVFKIVPVILIVAFLIVAKNSYAQEDSCLSKLKKAQELFESGLIEEIPSMLEQCIKSGFNKEQKIQAYRLLIQVYLFDYNQEKAEKTMLDLLSEYPEYEVHSTDPVEFVNLFNQFQTIPRFSFSFNAGINMSNVSVLEQYSTGNLNKLEPEYNPNGINVLARISFEKYFGSKAWITVGGGYAMSGYKVSEPMNFGREVLTFSEKMQFVQVPHFFNYALTNSKKVIPYLFAGGQFNYLLHADGEINRRSLVESSTDLKGVSKDITSSRNREQYSALAGIGIRYKIASGYLRANLFYTYGLIDHVKSNSRFNDGENLFYFNHIDDKIRLNAYYFTIGYSFIFYKTVKKIETE